MTGRINPRPMLSRQSPSIQNHCAIVDETYEAKVSTERDQQFASGVSAGKATPDGHMTARFKVQSSETASLDQSINTPMITNVNIVQGGCQLQARSKPISSVTVTNQVA